MYECNRELTRYSITVSDDDALALHEAEYSHTGDVLRPAVEKMEGVYLHEFDLHFGAHVFVEIEAQHDSDETRQAVVTSIREAVEAAGRAVEADRIQEAAEAAADAIEVAREKSGRTRR